MRVILSCTKVYTARSVKRPNAAKREYVATKPEHGSNTGMGLWNNAKPKLKDKRKDYESHLL